MARRRKKAAKRSFEEEMEEAGEKFGRKMEKWGKRMENEHSECCQPYKKHGCGGLLFGLFLLAGAVIWLGNDLGMWSINIPWGPLAVLFIALAIIMGSLSKWQG